MVLKYLLVREVAFEIYYDYIRPPRLSQTFSNLEFITILNTYLEDLFSHLAFLYDGKDIADLVSWRFIVRLYLIVDLVLLLASHAVV